jgi:hypothetical protein
MKPNISRTSGLEKGEDMAIPGLSQKPKRSPKLTLWTDLADRRAAVSMASNIAEDKDASQGEFRHFSDKRAVRFLKTQLSVHSSSDIYGARLQASICALSSTRASEPTNRTLSSRAAN